MNLRTLILRDEKGAVHIFPNGEVKTLANLSKDFSYYVITVGVAYDAEVDRAVEAMQEAASVVMKDPRSQPLHPRTPGGARGRCVRTGSARRQGANQDVPLKQWVVGRELRKQIARVFSERGIQMPTPHMTVRLDRTKSP